jgi:hypothetical protein
VDVPQRVIQSPLPLHFAFSRLRPDSSGIQPRLYYERMAGAPSGRHSVLWWPWSLAMVGLGVLPSPQMPLSPLPLIGILSRARAIGHSDGVER